MFIPYELEKNMYEITRNELLFGELTNLTVLINFPTELLEESIIKIMIPNE